MTKTSACISHQVVSEHLLRAGYQQHPHLMGLGKHASYWRNEPRVVLTIPTSTGRAIGTKLLCRILHDSRILSAERLLNSSAVVSNPCADMTSNEGFTRMQQTEREAIIGMLKETGHNKLETAKRLGIGRQTLYNKLKLYNIQS
jgi:transcriptional regulator with GAF, ATPase, and Fis domain